MPEINKILIPNKPHLDPIVAVYLLFVYGEEKYPGVKNSKIMFWGEAKHPSEEQVKEFEQSGGLMIDLGGGDFDHHLESENELTETTSELVAKKLGITENPETMQLLAYIREEDLEGLHNRYGELGFLLKNMYKQNYPQLDVVRKAFELLNIFQQGQKEFFIHTREEFEQKAKVENIKGRTRKWKVCVVESDNLQVGNYAITQGKVSVVVQKRSTGHVMILTNKNHRVDLREIVARIRKRDLELRNYDKPIELERLKFYGNNNLIPYWFYHKVLNSFLNGSDAMNKTEATKVPFDEIVKIVFDNLP